MNRADLQTHLKETGRYSGAIDGIWGPLSKAATLLMLTDGPDTPLTDADLRLMASRNNLTFAQVKAVTSVESAGAGFFAGKPLILPEPHRFSKATSHRFDDSNPDVSYPNWGAKPYPKTQDGRYEVLLKMISLDVDAGFGSASYGRFQIMGENFKSCGFSSTMAFAEAQARDEQTQLTTFEVFLHSTGLLSKLAACTTDPDTCIGFARGYNGTGFAKQNYHGKIAAQIQKWGGQ